jgi:hypothetical protein
MPTEQRRLTEQREGRRRPGQVRVAATGEYVRPAAHLHVRRESPKPLAASLTFGNNTPDA